MGACISLLMTPPPTFHRHEDPYTTDTLSTSYPEVSLAEERKPFQYKPPIVSKPTTII